MRVPYVVLADGANQCFSAAFSPDVELQQSERIACTNRTYKGSA